MNRPLISIDPSITCTGLAVFNLAEDFVDGALIKPKQSIIRQGCRTPISAPDRIDELIATLGDWYSKYPQAMFAVEITSGKTAGRLGKNVQGLGTYGMVVGHVVRWAICQVGNDLVFQVPENQWTRGSSKQRRQDHVALSYPIYKEQFLEKDRVKVYTKNRVTSGGDMSDAIGVGDFVMSQLRLGLIGGAA